MRAWVRLNVAFFLVGSLLFFGAGCGKQETHYPVSGKVTLNNAPLKGGIVTFIPDESKGNKSKSNATGMINAEGNYTLMTNGRSGAPAGWYKVTVNPDTPSGMGGAAEPGKNPQLTPLGGGVKIEQRFKDPGSTPITKEVVASGAAAGHYDLAVQ